MLICEDWAVLGQEQISIIVTRKVKERRSEKAQSVNVSVGKTVDCKIHKIRN